MLQALNKWLRQRDLAVSALLCLVALMVFWQYDPANHRLESDPSYMLYAGQQILRGHPPYVGVTIVKTPLTAMLSAGAIAAGRALNLDDIFAARAAFILLAALLAGVLYLYAAALWTRWAGGFAALALIGSEMLGKTLGDGPAPKVLFILFGMTALWLTLRRRYFWAGALGALSFLSWQPGLLFVAAAAIGALLDGGPSSTVFRLPSLFLGALVPLALVAVYLALGDALVAGIRQTFFANASYLDTVTAHRSVLETMGVNAARLPRLAPRCLSDEGLILAARVIGILGFCAAGIAAWARRREGARGAQIAPLLFALLVIGGFTLVDLQSCPDLLPFVPFLALGTGWLLGEIVGQSDRVLAHSPRGKRARYAVPAAIVILLAIYAIYNLLTTPPLPGLAAQQQMARSINRYLAPGDKLQQFGDAVALILLKRENATRYIHLGQKQGEGVVRAEGFVPQELPALLAQARPRVITLSRAKDEVWAKPLYEFLADHYHLAESFGVDQGGTPQITDVYVLAP